MRHRKDTNKLGRTSSHRQAMIVNMLKSLIQHGRIETTVAKAKVLRRYADQMVTMAKEQSLASRRRAIAALRIQYNSLERKEVRAATQGNKTSYNGDRLVIDKLFGELATRFATRSGGYTRMVRLGTRIGDGAMRCAIEYIPE
jgi:large subunit ribosomal protein L17